MIALIALIALAACGNETKATPTAEPVVSLAPRPPVDVACIEAVEGSPRCFLSDAERLDLRNQVRDELQRIEGDFIAAWSALPGSYGRQIWLSFTLRLDLITRGIDAPVGLSVPHAYQLLTEDNYRRLPSVDDLALRNMHSAYQATTRAQIAKSIIDYDAELKRAIEWRKSHPKK